MSSISIAGSIGEQVYSGIEKACLDVFGCEPDMNGFLAKSCFVPKPFKYLVWFANANRNIWIDTLENGGNEIREESVVIPCPHTKEDYFNDNMKRIVFFNFGDDKNKQYKFVGVFELDKNRFQRDVHYFVKISDKFPVEN